MGIGASISATSSSDYKSRSTERILPRGIVYCHSCCSFSYQSRSAAYQEGGTIYCPRVLCRPSPQEQLEEIPASVEGSLRLQAIMLELINARAATRSRTVVSSTSGLRTQDVILAIEIVPFNPETMSENQYCSICSDDFVSGSHDCCSNEDRPRCISDDCTDIRDIPVDCNVMKLPCGHIFHESCILPWLACHQTCPCCRHRIERFPVIPTPDELSVRYSEEQLITKIQFASTTNFGLSYSKSKGNRIDRNNRIELTSVNSHLDSPGQTGKKEELAIRLHAFIVASS